MIVRQAHAFRLIAGLAVTLLVGSPVALAEGGDPVPTQMTSFVEKYCVQCHEGSSAEAGFDLTKTRSIQSLLRDRRVWLEAQHQVATHAMPPEEPKPTSTEREAFQAWINREIVHADWKKYSSPGRVSLARITALEYQNSIRDIFGVDVKAGVYLNRDSEGNTGFTNDRDNLSFPIFAMQDYLREAERAVDTILGYGKPRWVQSLEMEDEWAKRSDKPAPLTEDGTAVIAQDAINPFHFAITVPYSNLYRFRITARTIDNEPLSGLQVIVSGRMIDKLIIEGESNRDYDLELNLPEGFSNVSLLYSPDRAPIIQPKFEPRSVPKALEQCVQKIDVPKLDVPAALLGNQDSENAIRRLNTVMADMTRLKHLAEFLVDRGETDYEHHTLTKDSDREVLHTDRVAEFRMQKVPLNLSAGKVALLLDIPQRKLEDQIEKDLGFSFNACVKSVNAYKEAFGAKHPERIKKIAGKVAVDRLEISSHAQADNESAPSWIFDQSNDEKGARIIVEGLASRAFRRPPTGSQVDSLLAIYRQTRQETQSHVEGLRDMLTAMLVSPPFLMRYIETDSVDNGLKIDSYDIASRIAGFLWLSIPDETLKNLTASLDLDSSSVPPSPRVPLPDDGARGEGFRTGSEFDAILDHALASPKFMAFCECFTEEWLNFKNLEELNVNLQQALKAEPAYLLSEILRDDRSILELVAPDHSWINSVLADHYDLAPIAGIETQKVNLNDRRRGGLVSMGAVLASTSTESRTSPVMRGAWIVETLLGERLPLPPPSVPELTPDKKSQTVREALEQHRQSAQCASCHAKIDPFGFVLENYDRTGMWRDKEQRKPIDASTTLANGTKLNGVEELKAYLTTQRGRDFAKNLTERMFAFALGREVEYYDEAFILATVDAMESDGWKSKALLRAILGSEAFNKQLDKQSAGR
jgi:hypothetical protein